MSTKPELETDILVRIKAAYDETLRISDLLADNGYKDESWDFLYITNKLSKA